jgi:hypothetical protein
MKKLLPVMAALLSFSASQGQIKNLFKKQNNTVQPVNQQNNIGVVNNSNNIAATNHFYVPVRKNVNFMEYRANLPIHTNPPDANNLADIPVQNNMINMNNQTNSVNQTQMDNRQVTSNQVINRTVNQVNNIRNSQGNMTNPGMNPEAMAPALSNNYTVTKKSSDGHLTKFTLTPDIGTWDAKPQIDAKQANKTNDNSNPSWNCVNSTINVNARSSSFMNALPGWQASYLVPGMVYSFDDYSSGNFNEQYNKTRNPLKLSCDVYNAGKITSTVSDPGLSSIRTGLDSIVKSFSPGQAGADYQINTTMVDNQNVLNLVANAGGAFGGFSINTNFIHDESSHHIYYTIDAIKTLYTINVEMSSPVYTNEIPVSNSPLVMIQNVTYGARVLANMDIEFNDKSDLGGVSLNYNAGFGSASFDFKTLFKNNSIKITINGYLIGFPSNIQGSFTATRDDFFTILDQFFSKCDYNSAKPIQYSFVDMKGNLLGVESATDKFNVRNCTPADEVFTLESVLANFTTGNDSKNNDSEFWLTLGYGNPNSFLHWVAQYYDNYSEFKKEGNPYTVNLKHHYDENQARFSNVESNSYFDGVNLGSFKSGGMVTLKLIQHNHWHDDWDFGSLTITLNFMSQKGTSLQKLISVGNFRISEMNDHPEKNSKEFYFDGNFAVQ